MVCCVLPPQHDVAERPLTNWESFRKRTGVVPPPPEDQDDKLHCFESGLLKGLQYRQYGSVLFPRPLTRKVLEAVRTVQLRSQDTLICLPPELAGHNLQIEESLFQLAENRCEGTQTMVPFGPYGMRIPPLEAKVSLGLVPAQTSPARRQCHWTFVQPTMLPHDEDGKLSIGGKVVVLLSDPRYVLFRHRDLWNRVRWMSTPAEAAFYPKEFDFGAALEHYLESDCHFGGHVIDRYRDWMVEQQRAPHKVKIIFLEDLVRDSEVVVKGLAQFLEVDDPRVPCSVISSLKVAQEQSGLIKAGRSGTEEFDFMTRISKEFERCLSMLPYSAQESWRSSLRQFLAVADPRCRILANQLLEHGPWQEAATWAAHNLMMCRPCSFAPRGICRSAEECNFCHVPGHAAPARRPSKKERMRRQRRLQRLVSRTPSPEGLSS
mmetsp:Transcript_1220/g.2761  ORF Transcript_1220/g.2761 Transcript_1220/m.2761 type:complete len:434 (+) Transcript_1220:40-1341(+)